MDSDMHTDDERVSEPEPIVIENDVWIGMYSSVLKGVTIGEGTFVAAHSLVNESLPAQVIAAGIPARVVRGLYPAK
jgi:acetyltransferase-like isoleucine patch superfamily enzyme